MSKKLKWILGILGILVIVLFAAFKFMQYNTKKASPETTAEYTSNGNKIVVNYSQPSKKGREIFGGLVPYGKVWRTGANEPTTFTTEKELNVGGKTLPAGTYTLWTIPEKDHWTVIFNSKQYDWGINWDGTSTHEPEADVAQIQVPVQTTTAPTESFTISFEETDPAMVLAWDQTRVVVPFR
ncbi:DUF2911 domain-containing protein [Telluribacter humicola]|uniref:DUF2911 domain-containing protein n=1 Tax=Telluribacter humicola TaxID=1720261 RepID=UPI001A9632A2|nr:DUF2911 domain-containing protein [Telluribacter humicola]